MFIAVLIFGILYRDWLNDAVLPQILYVIWVGEQAFQSYSQEIVWVTALIIALVIGVANLIRKTARSIHQAQSAARRSSPSQGRIKDWVIQIRMSSGDAYPPKYRNWELRRLFLKAQAHLEKSEPEAIIEKIRSGELDVPEAVRFVFEHSRGPERRPEPEAGFLDLFQRLLRRGRDDPEPVLPDPRLYKAADYLESMLEGGYEF